MSSNASLFIMHRDEALYLTASIILSATYHYMGLQLARAVSATSLLAAQSPCRWHLSNSPRRSSAFASPWLSKRIRSPP